MKKVLLFSVLQVFLVLLAAVLSGCGSSGVLPTPAPPGPGPGPGPTPSETSNMFAALRTDGTTSGGAALMTRQQRQAARHAAKLAHATRQQQAAITPDSGPVNIYVWPAIVSKEGWWIGTERKITDSAAAYTSVHLSLNGTSIVFSATVNGYNQIFTSTVPEAGQTAAAPIQLTTDLENHWVPHISADGSTVVFTKADPNSTGDVVCVIGNFAGATETCLDFSSTTPVLKEANMWHASWTPDDRIVFEAWGGPLNSDEIFMYIRIANGLTQITNNVGTKNYDECPSVSSNENGTYMAVNTWNDTTRHYEITQIDLNTKQRIETMSLPDTDFWDPLRTGYTTVWVADRETDQSDELYMMTFDYTRVTNNTYADYFESSPKQ
jgi:hypothetical protein